MRQLLRSEPTPARPGPGPLPEPLLRALDVSIGAMTSTVAALLRKGVTSMALGNFQSCAVLTDGSVTCWSSSGASPLPGRSRARSPPPRCASWQ